MSRFGFRREATIIAMKDKRRRHDQRTAAALHCAYEDPRRIAMPARQYGRHPDRARDPIERPQDRRQGLGAVNRCEPPPRCRKGEAGFHPIGHTRHLAGPARAHDMCMTSSCIR